MIIGRGLESEGSCVQESAGNTKDGVGRRVSQVRLRAVAGEGT